MASDTTKQAWDRLKEEYGGSRKTKTMQLLNLRREFEFLKMKKTETIKDYSDKLLKVVNQIWVLGEDLPDNNVVQKVLVSISKRFEVKIFSLEDSKDLTTISLGELISALQVYEQRRLLRQEDTIEGALQVTYH